jgi:flagellar assembly factor FliW
VGAIVDSAQRKDTQEKLVGSLLQGEPHPFFFPEGLLGFSQVRRFTLSRYQPGDGSESPFFVLQAVDGDLSFPLVSPRLLVPDYQPAPSTETLVRLATDTMDDVVTLAIVTLRPRLQEITANLQGPLLLNPIARLGLQIIAERYAVRHPLIARPSTTSKKPRQSNRRPDARRVQHG